MNGQTRARGEGRIFVRGKVVWIQFQDARHYQVRESTGLTVDSESWEKSAAKLLRKKLGEVAAGVHRDTRRVTYEQLREAYYQDYRINGRKSLHFDRDGAPHLDKVARLDNFFSGFLASEITTDLLRKFATNQQTRGLSNGSINRSLSALRRMFHLAKQDERLRDIPYFPMLKESKPREGFVEFPQYEKLLHSLPGYLRLPLALGFFTGMRLSEVRNLTWEQVNFLTNEITLRETKNDEGRTIPIPAPLRTLLLEQRAQRQAGCPLVCFKLRRGVAVSIRTFRKAWLAACARAGLAGLLFHDLRRSSVRNSVRAGIPEKVAMKISGHKTRAVFDRYNIVSGSDLADAGRKLETYFGDNSGTIPAADSVVN
jgi:integrase